MAQLISDGINNSTSISIKVDNTNKLVATAAGVTIDGELSPGSDRYRITSSQANYTASSTQTLDSLAIATYRSAKFNVQVSATGQIGTLGTITGGSTYVAGTYTNVPLTGGTGSGAFATIVVIGTAVSSVTIVDPGSGYTVADSLSTAGSNLGGGTGFAVPVSTLTSNHMISDILLIHDGTTADILEFGNIGTASIPLGNFFTDILSSNMRLRFAPTYQYNTIKVARHAFTV